jgi:hypothetical protein
MQALREASLRSEGVHLNDPIDVFVRALVDVFIVHRPDLSFVSPIWCFFYYYNLLPSALRAP